MTHLDGFCDDRFLALADEFRANLGSGVDLGGSLAATLNGDVVVNLWGGFRYSERSVPWTEDTLATCFPMWYEPGTISCYHSMTHGYMLGELVRRLSAMPFDEFFRREISGPLEADFYFGLHTAAEQERAAELMYPKNLPPGESPMGLRVFCEGEWGTGSFRRGWLRSYLARAGSAMRSVLHASAR